jgi:hypothetical protein
LRLRWVWYKERCHYFSLDLKVVLYDGVIDIIGA